MKAKEVTLGEIFPPDAMCEDQAGTVQAESYLKELEPLRWNMIAGDLSKSAIGVLFRKDRLVWSSGFRPAEGCDWRHVCGSYRFSEDKKAIRECRHETLRQILKVLEQMFEKAAGKNANAEEWKLIALQGWFLKENACKNVKGESWVIVDSTLAFVPKAVK